MKKTWINVNRELLKHRKRIGLRIWLYLYIAANPNWTPRDVSLDLDMEIGLVKRQARELASMGYIEWNESFYKNARKTDIPNELRWTVWERDNFTCKCGARKFLSIDHIKPESEGGLTELDNLRTLCKSCNSKKGTKKAGNYGE
jgi:hypothetical protein